MPGAYKLLWDFLYHDCDHAGIWIVDIAVAQMYVGSDMILRKEKAIELFNSDELRIIEIDHGKKWFIPSFIEFQYGTLSEKNRAHTNVIFILKKYDLLNKDLTLKILDKPLTSPLQGDKEKEMEQEKEMDKEQEKENAANFEKHLVPEMLRIWKTKKPNYPIDKDKDLFALGEIGKFIADQLSVPYNPRDGDTLGKILLNWAVMADYISKTDFINSYSLTTVARNTQTIVQKIQNGDSKNSKSGAGKVTSSDLHTVFAKRYPQRQ